MITQAKSITLPKISKSSIVNNSSIKPNLSFQDSPFRFPSDDEIFITKEKKNKILSQIQNSLKSLRIWEKKTASTYNSLNRIKIDEFDSEIKGKTPLKIKESQKSCLLA